jgi:RNA polymerase sigma factor (sigma-70 family)
MHTEDSELELQAGLQRLSEPEAQAAMQTDAELLELYLYGGSHEAMVTLVQRFAPLVASVIRRVVSHPQDAEDAFQATFVILLKSARSIRSRRSIAAWLYGVAYRTACRVRAKSRRRAISLGDADMPEPDSNRNPIAELSRQIELSSLDRELEQLPDGLREPVVEHYILGYSARQIADRMELSTSAVEGRLRRGRRLLRHRLAVRGCSLSVLVSGAAWLRDHSTTAHASDQWAGRMLQMADANSSDSSNASNSSISLDSFLSTDPYISQLVHGELAMRLAPLVKPLGMLTAATVVTAVSISVFALSPQFGGSQPLSAAPSTGLPEPAEAPADEVPAKVPIVAAKVDAPQPVKSQIGDDPNKVASVAPILAKADSASVPTFVRPEGAPPSWLRAGTEDLQAREKIRQRCREIVEVDFTGVPLTAVIQTFADQLRLDIIIDNPSLDNAGVDLDTPITLTLHQPPLCEALEQILDRLAHTYEVRDYSIKIVARESVTGSVRYYDLAYLLPTAAGINDLVRTIQSTVSPGDWESNGGEGTIGVIGSMMVVNCGETAHRQIEKLLAELSKMNPENLRNATSTPWPAGMGGMGGGGGMGGMGGGGGGMGGMF